MDGSLACSGCRERDARIAVLEQRVAEQAATLHAQEAILRELQGHVKDLKVKLSDKEPPARPAPDLPPGPDKKPSGRKQGGQPGHPAHLKRLLSADRVGETIQHVPETCTQCQAALPKEAGPNDPAPSRHQVAELPKILAVITEHQGHYRTCSCCGKVNHAPIPSEICKHSIGPHLTSVAGYMSGAQGISKRGIEEIFETVFDAPVSLGTIANLEKEIGEAMAPAHAEATAAVSDAPVKNVDETGWKLKGMKRWLWVAATTVAAVFVIHANRDINALRSLLGGKLMGILCSDRWIVYRRWPDEFCRQLCWAHLKRNWEKMVLRGGSAKRFAVKCLAIHQKMFEHWHLFRGGGCTRAELVERSLPLVESLQEIIASGTECGDTKTQRFCARLLKESYGLWTFLETEGVEPTNNHGERVLRYAVIWRRRSFGSQSDAGCRYAERMLTVVQTLRLQKRNVLQFLSESVSEKREGRTGPKLIPAG